jgi:uncharacterized protein YjdB
MKQYFRITMLWLAVAMIAPMMTSCDEFFSLLDNPVTPALRVYTETLVVGEGHSLKINATTQDHVMLTYASSNPSVAIVDAEGNVIGVSEGKATITVTAQGDDDYYRNQIFGTNTHTVDVAVVKYDPTAIKLLADAQKEGALVSITFNLDGTDYIAYFRLINGEYVLQSSPAAARAAAPAATRAAAPARGVTGASAPGSTIIYSEGASVPVRMTLTLNTFKKAKKTADLIVTWTDKKTGYAIAQAQIYGATAAVSVVNAASHYANGHSVAMGDVQINGETAHSKDDHDKADAGGGTSTTTGSGGSGGGGSSSFSVTKAEFSPAIVEMLISETLQLKYSYSPSNAKVYFSTENSNLITIDEKTGEVKALAEGRAKVNMNTTATDGANICVAQCDINIADPDKLNTLYNRLNDGKEITSEKANMDIRNLTLEFAYTFEEMSLFDAVMLRKKICEEKSLTNVLIIYGGDEYSGYTFCVNDSYGTETLKPTDAIPSDWIGATLFYVKQ